MSLLLDALNKADQERKRGDGPPSIDSHHNGYTAHAEKKSSTPIIVLSIFTALSILLAAVYWLAIHTQQAAIVTNPSTTAQAIITQKHEPNITNNSAQNSHSDNLNQIKAEPNIEDKKDVTSDDQGVASLYQQQVVNNSNAISSPETAPNATENAVNSNHAPESDSSITSPTSIKQFANLPEIQDLPSVILEKIPSLKYTEHNYNQYGGNVKINGNIKHVNDELAPGVVIDKILTDGMILHFENYSFKMRALGTWINM